MKRKKIVVALGHKALGTTLPEQKAAVKRSAKVIADLVAAGAGVVINSAKCTPTTAQPRCLSAPL